MFPRASKKTHEVRFFLNHLRQDNLEPEDVESYLSALLSAGKSVTYVLTREFQKVKKGHKYGDLYNPWHNALSLQDRDLFDLFQALRDVEVHSDNEATAVTSRTEARPAFEMRRSGPNTPVVAQLLALVH